MCECDTLLSKFLDSFFVPMIYWFVVIDNRYLVSELRLLHWRHFQYWLRLIIFCMNPSNIIAFSMLWNWANECSYYKGKTKLDVHEWWYRIRELRVGVRSYLISEIFADEVSSTYFYFSSPRLSRKNFSLKSLPVISLTVHSVSNSG